MYFQVNMERKARHIMVMLDPREVLADTMEIQVAGYCITQNLDYEQFTYQCHCYHKHDNLATDYPLGIRRRRKNMVEMVQDM